MNNSARQIPLDLGHRPAHGRDDFLVAPNNEQAVSWVDRWPGWPAPALVLYGPAACGKTHLAAVWREKVDGVMISGETFTRYDANELSQMGSSLAIDNIGPWLGDREAETILFHLYNILKEEGRTMLLTMRFSPAQAEFAVPDLASRLRAAPAVAIAPPDDALLAAVLVKLFTDRQLKIGTDVLKYTVPRMERSFAAARDLVQRADRLALSEKRSITVPLMRRVLFEESPGV